jgi:hypothetical protein
MIYNIKFSDGNRENLIKYILEQKQNGKFTVIDVGGSVTSWSAPYVDAVVDFNDLEVKNSNIEFFKCDITHPENYKDIFNYIEKNGKFDFAICCHTLEDIMNPVYVCEQLCKISKQGYIAFPSKYRELSRFEGNYRGYIHHRWIFDIKTNSEIIAYPKINYIENNYLFDSISNMSENIKDLSFFWKDNINLTYVNNNYLGPSCSDVINYYKDLLIPSHI